MAFLVKDLVDRQIFGGVRLVAGVLNVSNPHLKRPADLWRSQAGSRRFKCFKPYFMGQCNGNTGHSQIFK